MIDSLKSHWPEYTMEAAELGLFMLSAAFFGTLLEYRASPLQQDISNPSIRRIIMGLAMGLTALAIIYSPWGKRSGAHFNPAITLTFFWLGLVDAVDAAWYVVAQFAGAILPMVVAALALGPRLASPPVDYVVTVPGHYGSAAAFVAELLMAVVLMAVVLLVTNNSRLHRWTGLFAAALVALFIMIESPISGMSINPARTLGSAIVAQVWNSLWLYFIAPPLGMLLAGETYVTLTGRVYSAKLHHANNERCIFHCHEHARPRQSAPRMKIRQVATAAAGA